MTRKYICLTCNKNTGVDIVYGEPSIEIARQVELGEIALGGCVIEPNQPNYRCMSCGFEWDRTLQFEEAKQRWLKEDVKGRGWTQNVIKEQIDYTLTTHKNKVPINQQVKQRFSYQIRRSGVRIPDKDFREQEKQKAPLGAFWVATPAFQQQPPCWRSGRDSNPRPPA